MSDAPATADPAATRSVHTSHGQASDAAPAAADLAPTTTGDAPTDDEYMIALQEGRAAAFDALVDRHRAPLEGFFFKNTRDRMLAEDLAQETLLKVYSQAWDYIPMGRFKAWMYRMGRNLLIDTVRKQTNDVILRASRGSDADETDRLARFAGEFMDPQKAASLSERRDSLDTLLADLPEDQRQTVTLHYYNGLPLSEVADVMETNVSTCKSRLRLARDKLRGRIEAAGWHT